MRTMGRNFCFLREEGKEKSEEKRKDKNFSQKQGGGPPEKSLPLGVVPRAANKNLYDCRWQSYLY